MKILIKFIAVLILAFSANAQTGIGYKAIIKDDNGNVIADRTLEIYYTILLEDSTLYAESQRVQTDTNGLMTATIGTGDVIAGVFSDIPWNSVRGPQLNVQVDVGEGPVDLGNTPIVAVPYALRADHAEVAANVMGLEAVDEGNGIGWRLIGRDTLNYGDIGLDATDLSYSGTNDLAYGATGTYSMASGSGTIASGNSAFASGQLTVASGDYAIAMGRTSEASGNFSTALGQNANASGGSSVALGFSTTASGSAATAMGNDTLAEGRNTTAMGTDTRATAFGSIALGRYNEGTGDPNNWVASEALVEVGNGTSNGERNNALTILKNGQHIINSEDDGLVINSLDAGLIINSQSSGLNIPNAVNGILVSNSSSNAINIVDSGFRGLFISNPATDGIVVSNAQDDGLEISAADNGAIIFGDQVGLVASTASNVNPDIILAGTAEFQDDGIISTSPEFSGSDMLLRSYDAVTVQLDFDNDESGNFRVNNGSGVNVFDINESGNAILAGSLTQNSDRRLKKDITDLQYGLSEIVKLQPKTYHWKNNTQSKRSLGLIAQDVQSIIPEIVNTQENDAKTLGISYTELIPVLINAIKELKQENTSLRSDISALQELVQGKTSAVNLSSTRK